MSDRQRERDDHSPEQLRLGAELRAGIDRGELQIHYQPERLPLLQWSFARSIQAAVLAVFDVRRSGRVRRASGHPSADRGRVTPGPERR